MFVQRASVGVKHQKDATRLRLENQRLKSIIGMRKQQALLAADESEVSQLRAEVTQLGLENHRLKTINGGMRKQMKKPDEGYVEASIYKEELKKSNLGNMRLKSEMQEIKAENAKLKRELSKWEEIKEDNEYLKSKVKRLKKSKDSDEDPEKKIQVNEATKSELHEIRNELNNVNKKYEKAVQELVSLKKKHLIQTSMLTKQHLYEEKIKYLVKKNVELGKDKSDCEKVKDELETAKIELKNMLDQNANLKVKIKENEVKAKENEALKKTLKIQQEFLEIAKCHVKGVPVTNKDLEQEVRMMLVEQFGREVIEKLGIEIEDGEILDGNNAPDPDRESGIEILEAPEKNIEVVELDMD